MFEKEIKCPRCKSSIVLTDKQAQEEYSALVNIFLSKIDKSGECHLWTGSKSSAGYGVITRKFTRVQAHRFSWEFHNKTKIPCGLFVLHKCDNPICVNPKHLFVGGHQENVNDMIDRNRKKSHGKLILNVDQVKEIKELLNKGVPSNEIAKRFNTSPNSISRIKTGRNWKNI